MKGLRSIICDPEKPQNTLKQINHGINEKAWMQLISKKDQAIIIRKAKLPLGPGVIINSGGSTGRHRQCLIPCSHLDQSALASAHWIKTQGLDPKNCQILNSLPLHHISGLMAWWRSRCWQSKYISIPPSLMRNPNSLEQRCRDIGEAVKITSLVPTQVSRLLKESAGIRWLQSFSIIWLGGSLLADNLASAARSLDIRLAPCYGATETTAMIAVQSPKDFLIGNSNYSNLLEDIEVQLGTNNRLEVKTSRLAKAEIIDDKYEKVTNNEGWWESGDAAELIINNFDKKLRVIGRIDTAINSGGETVFPEILEIRLLNLALQKGIPIEEFLLVPIDHEEWGQRFIALVRFSHERENSDEAKLLLSLQKLAKSWPSCEQPISWHKCPDLKRNAAGKWDLKRWKSWLRQNQ